MSYDFSPKEGEENFQPTYKKEIIICVPVAGGEKRRVEVEYKQIRPNVWEKIPGSEKDLEPIIDQNNK